MYIFNIFYRGTALSKHIEAAVLYVIGDRKLVTVKAPSIFVLWAAPPCELAGRFSVSEKHTQYCVCLSCDSYWYTLILIMDT
jgi:hypothetical protein